MIGKTDFWTLASHFLKGPPRPLPQTLPGTPPIFGDILSDTPRCTSGPKGPKTPVGGRISLKKWSFSSLGGKRVQLRFCDGWMLADAVVIPDSLS